jgi:hypothetical protein
MIQYDDDVYIKKFKTRGVTKFNPTQKCRPAKGMSKRVNIQIIKDTDMKEQPKNKKQYGVTWCCASKRIIPCSKLKLIKENKRLDYIITLF